MHRAGRRSRVSVLVAASAASVVTMMFAMSGVAGAVASAGTTTDDEATATLQIIEPNVTVKRADKENFKPAREGQRLRVGDTVKTDATGFAQVNYTDDSFTRLDVNTTFTIVSLTDDEGNRQIKGSVEGGQTWNRTSALTESETFEQEGAGATAAVTGSAFFVSCLSANNCAWTAVDDGLRLLTVDGELQILDPLEGCESIEVTPTDGSLCGVPEEVALQVLLADAFFATNYFLDASLGLPLPVLPITGTVEVDDEGNVTFTPTPPTDTDDPPVIDGNLVNITSTGNDPTPGESTGPNTKVSSQDEREDVTFVLQVTSGDHDFYILFTVLPDPTFGHLYDEADNLVDLVTEYDPDMVFRFDPIEIEPICDPSPTDLEDCYTFGNPENADHTTYPTGDDAPVDFGDGTVRWYGSFTFRAVDETDPTVFDEATVTLEAVEDVCTPGAEGDRGDATDVVDSCNEDA